LNWYPWYRDILRRIQDSPACSTKLISQAQPTFQVYGHRFKVATLTDQQTIATRMAHFKERVRDELGLQL
jgi:hypothetical protein